MATSDFSGSEKFCQFGEEEVNRLETIFEQIKGCGDLLLWRLDPADNFGAMSAITIIAEKAQEAQSIVRAGCMCAAAIRKASE
jgi:hypothetical protein